MTISAGGHRPRCFSDSTIEEKQATMKETEVPEFDSSDSDEVKRKKKKHHKKKHKKESKKKNKEKRSRSKEDVERTEDRKKDEEEVKDKDEEEVKDKDKDDNKESESRRRETSTSRHRDSKNNRAVESTFGRKLKGRGAIRFKSRSRSTTPPYWKQEQKSAIPLHLTQENEEKSRIKRELITIQTSDQKNVRRDRNELTGFDRGGEDVKMSDEDRSVENNQQKQKRKEREDRNEYKKREYFVEDNSNVKAENMQRKDKAEGPRDQSEDSEIETGSECEDGEILNRKDKVLVKERSKEARIRRDRERVKSNNMPSPDSKKESKSSRNHRNKDAASLNVHYKRRESQYSQSSDRNESRRRDSHERYHPYSKRIDYSKRGNKEYRYSLQEPLSKNSDRFEDVKYRQHKDMRSRPPKQPLERSKWNSRSRSISPDSTKKAPDDPKEMLQKIKRRRSPSRDYSQYQVQDVRKSLSWQRRSMSGDFTNERDKKRRKSENQEKSSLSEEHKPEEEKERIMFKSFERVKSDSPPPSHWKPGQKQLKNSGKTDKHKNPFEEASMSALQKAKALLKAELAADYTDETLSLPVIVPVSSSKIIYKLDSTGEQIQYNITTDVKGEIPSGKLKGKRSTSHSRSRSHSASHSRSSRSSSSDASRSTSVVKASTAKADTFISQDKEKDQRSIKAQEKDKIKTDKKSDECTNRPITTAMQPLDKVEEAVSELVKQENEDLLQETAHDELEKRSDSPLLSSSPRQRQLQSSNETCDKLTLKCDSRSGSESPSHLRASLLEQKRRKTEEEIEKNLSAAYNKNVDVTRSEFEKSMHKSEQKSAPSRQESTRNKGSYPKKQIPKSSSSSPEPPPVIPRVHRSQLGVPFVGGVTIDNRGKAEDIASLKKSNTESPSTFEAPPSPHPRQPSLEEEHTDDTLPAQQPDFSTLLHENMSTTSQSTSGVKDVSSSSDIQAPVSKLHLPVVTIPNPPPLLTSMTGSATAETDAHLSVELPLSLCIPLPPTPTKIKQPPIIVMNMDHIELSSVPLPAEIINTSSTSAQTSVKKPTNVKGLDTEKEKYTPLSGLKLLESIDTTQRKKESEFDHSNRSRSSSSSSCSSSKNREKPVLVTEKTSIDKANEELEKANSGKQQMKEKDTPIVKSVADSKTGEASKEDKSKEMSKKKVSEKEVSDERKASKSNRTSRSSLQDKSQSRNRSKSKESRSRKKSVSPVRRRSRSRSYSRRGRRSPPRQRSRSRSPQRQFPLRSNWTNRRRYWHYRPPVRRRSRSQNKNVRYRHSNRRTSSHSKSRSSSHSRSRSKRRSSTSSSD